MVPEHEGVEEDDDDADIEVKDVAQDRAFLEVLELEESGGDSDNILDFLQDVKVVKD